MSTTSTGTHGEEEGAGANGRSVRRAVVTSALLQPAALGRGESIAVTVGGIVSPLGAPRSDKSPFGAMRLAMLPGSFSVDGGELTPTLSPLTRCVSSYN